MIEPLPIIITRDFFFVPNFGSHAAVRIDNSGNPLLYDPAGSFAPDSGPGAMRGTGDLFEGRDADLRNFVQYHKATGSRVELFRFHTTPEEEEAIAQRMKAQPGQVPGGQCSERVSGTIQGIGPFKSLGEYTFPGNLAGALERLQAPLPPPREPRNWHYL
jgi:hypothetical protein